MPNAVFVGFTGTPLLKQDKQTSLEVFGGYIHTYKFSEAVEDQVVLDLVYEARDIDQKLGSSDKIDAWFEAKTKGLNDWQKAALREQWGTMQNVLSSKSRMDRVVADIVFDFGTKPRLSNQRGNAILVASSIYEACKYFELFQKTVFKGNRTGLQLYHFGRTPLAGSCTSLLFCSDMNGTMPVNTELVRSETKDDFEAMSCMLYRRVYLDPWSHASWWCRPGTVRCRLAWRRSTNNCRSKRRYLRFLTMTTMNSGRKPDIEDCDAALRMDTNIATMGMGNGTGDGQPQTRSFAETLTRRINPIEAVK